MRIKKVVGFFAVYFVLIQTLPVLGKYVPPEKAYIEGVSGHPQSFILSCESRSAVDYAAFWGVRIRERKFQNELPRSENPDKGFVGNPNDPWGNIPPKSYGVHATPVAELLREYGLQVESRRNMKWSELQMEVSEGRPVIVWVVGQMWPGKSQFYQVSNGKKVKVAGYEHTMIMVGYNKNVVYAVDAYSGNTLAYSKTAFLKSWASLGNMAITGNGKKQKIGDDNLSTPPKNNPITLYLPLVNSSTRGKVVHPLNFKYTSHKR
jgi:uncharacterized protein YvpB